MSKPNLYKNERRYLRMKSSYVITKVTITQWLGAVNQFSVKYMTYSQKLQWIIRQEKMGVNRSQITGEMMKNISENVL